MPKSGAGRPWMSSRAHSIFHGLANVGARISAAVVLATGAVNGIAARRHEKHGDPQAADKGGDGGGPRDRAERHKHENDRADNRDRNRDRDDNQDADTSGSGRRKTNDSTNAENSSDSVRKEQSNGNNNNSNNNTTDTNTNNDASNDDTGGNESGNAGSGLFESSLATKAKRRAKDFEGNSAKDDEEDRLAVDVDSEGESSFQTGSIFFASGPDGLEVETRNISFTAAPTPTPTPFPRLELPERDRLDVFGDRVIAAPTPTPTGSAPAPSDPAPSDPGDDRPADVPAPTMVPSDTTGGDNSGDFLS